MSTYSSGTSLCPQDFRNGPSVSSPVTRPGVYRVVWKPKLLEADVEREHLFPK